MSISTFSPQSQRVKAQDLGRAVLTAFLLTFLAARILVILIMTHRVPDLYLHVSGTHVHHLNYGIFLLSGVGGYLLFVRSTPSRLRIAAAFYGVGLALTFDEFGMWLHLGGSYWQRASFDAIVVIAALLALIAVAPVITRFKPQHWATGILLIGLVCLFAFLMFDAIKHLGHHYLPRLQEIEAEAPV